jgi:hypothetical protein
VSFTPLRRSTFRFPDSFAMARFLRGLRTQEPDRLAEAARGNIGTLIVSVTRLANDKTERVEALAVEFGGCPWASE